jgi:hypothetical protein
MTDTTTLPPEKAKPRIRPAIPASLAILIAAAGAEYQRRPQRVDAIYRRVRRVIATTVGWRATDENYNEPVANECDRRLGIALGMIRDRDLVGGVK